MTWVDINTSFASADMPLHAGLCTDSISGNLAQMYTQSGIVLATSGWSTDDETSLLGSVDTDWAWLGDFGEHIIQMRRACSTSEFYRGYRFTVSARVVGAETVTLRACLFPTPYSGAIGSEAVFDTGSYAETTYGNLGQVRTLTIAPDGVGRQIPSPWASPPDGLNLPDLRIAYFRLAVKATGADTLRLRSVTVTEVP